MRIKTIIIIVIAILFIIMLLQNNGTVSFTILFGTFYMSKLAMLLLVAVIAFILGYLTGRPKNIKLGGNVSNGNTLKSNPDTLSDEDKEYIS